jgi:hypothetical protein
MLYTEQPGRKTAQVTKRHAVSRQAVECTPALGRVFPRLSGKLSSQLCGRFLPPLFGRLSPRLSGRLFPRFSRRFLPQLSGKLLRPLLGRFSSPLLAGFSGKFLTRHLGRFPARFSPGLLDRLSGRFSPKLTGRLSAQAIPRLFPPFPVPLRGRLDFALPALRLPCSAVRRALRPAVLPLGFCLLTFDLTPHLLPLSSRLWVLPQTPLSAS